MKYYIQNKDLGFLGNSIFFWALNSNGYTAKLDKAHQYTFEEAKKICENNPNKNKAWPVEYIDNNPGTTRVTDCQNLNKENIVNFSNHATSQKR